MLQLFSTRYWVSWSPYAVWNGQVILGFDRYEITRTIKETFQVPLREQRGSGEGPLMNRHGDGLGPAGGVAVECGQSCLCRKKTGRVSPSFRIACSINGSK